MTNVEEARFTQPSHPYTKTVHLPKPDGSTRDESILTAEAEEKVLSELSANEYVQQRVGISYRSMGNRVIWDVSFQIGLQMDAPEN
ncbi:hypothetical protein [Arthrobacter sp. AK04]|uniref:hypothetical protein n=1 Tax=Arthrobacter sp. AK04 TaxID=2900048 RepID=UPI001E4FA3DC|nr:hypothetical protein [Arthrobacter sp. AK04]